MHVLWLLLAADKPSKAPFYVIGGVFAAWAVLISVLGFRRHDFPSGDGQQRLVMGVTVLLAVGAIGSAIATA
ncbi:MAG: hypothetical protein ACR2HD_06045 [Solirubrobacteraceae bacterium]|nr:MAG: hypothetical protein DLM63_11005 [Solirubrobacterales bacterium]